MGLPCGMDKVDEDVFPETTTNLEEFLNDPLLLETAYTPYNDNPSYTVFTTTLTTFTDTNTVVSSSPLLCTTSSTASGSAECGVDEVLE